MTDGSDNAVRWQWSWPLHLIQPPENVVGLATLLSNHSFVSTTKLVFLNHKIHSKLVCHSDKALYAFSYLLIHHSINHRVKAMPMYHIQFGVYCSNQPLLLYNTCELVPGSSENSLIHCQSPYHLLIFSMYYKLMHLNCTFIIHLLHVTIDRCQVIRTSSSQWNVSEVLCQWPSCLQSEQHCIHTVKLLL